MNNVVFDGIREHLRRFLELGRANYNGTSKYNLLSMRESILTLPEGINGDLD